MEVSDVSLVSSTHQPHPPDGPKPARQPFRVHSAKVVWSPYLATTSTPKSHKRTESHQRSRPQAKNPLQRSHISPALLLPAEHGTQYKWRKTVKRGWLSEKGHSPSASLFSNVVHAAVKQTRKRSHSSAAASVTNGDSGDLCDLREELRSVRGDLVRVGKERDGALVRVRVIESELARKQKMVEELLAGGHITARDATRSLGKPKPVPGSTPPSTGPAPSLISTLQLKVVRLEQRVREKERELKKMSGDLRVSRVKEAEEEKEVYFREVCRLSSLLDHTTSDGRALRDAESKAKQSEEAKGRLSGKVTQLQDKCDQLSSELERALRTNPLEPITHNEQGLRGSIADRYVDHRRSQLLSAIIDQELKAQEQEAAMSSLCREMEEKQSLHSTTLSELSTSHSDALNKIASLEKNYSDVTDSLNKARRVVRRLKEDRNHYRQLHEQTQSALNSVQAEKDQLLAEQTALVHIQNLDERKSSVLSPDHRSRQRAAVILQRGWRKRRAELRQQKFQERRDRATLTLQNVFRAHLSRKHLTSLTSLTHQTTPTHHETTPTNTT